MFEMAAFIYSVTDCLIQSLFPSVSTPQEVGEELNAGSRAECVSVRESTAEGG